MCVYKYEGEGDTHTLRAVVALIFSKGERSVALGAGFLHGCACGYEVGLIVFD